jgi:hypothetical protein
MLSWVTALSLQSNILHLSSIHLLLERHLSSVSRFVRRFPPTIYTPLISLMHATCYIHRLCFTLLLLPEECNSVRTLPSTVLKAYIYFYDQFCHLKEEQRKETQNAGIIFIVLLSTAAVTRRNPTAAWTSCCSPHGQETVTPQVNGQNSEY